jgi:TonB family protein
MQNVCRLVAGVLIAISFYLHAQASLDGSAGDTQSSPQTPPSECIGNLSRQVRPDYPKKAMREGVTGEVWVKAVIGRDGKLKDVKPESGPPLLIEATVRAVSKWRYKPCRLNGETIEVATRIRITFKLDSSGSPRISANYFADATQPAEIAPDFPVKSASSDEGTAKVYSSKAPGINGPQLISGRDAQYPESARRAGVEGTVVLDCIITSEGTVRDLVVFRSLDPSLDEEAMNTVREWRCRPATKDGRPVSVKARIPVHFRLY